MPIPPLSATEMKPKCWASSRDPDVDAPPTPPHLLGPWRMEPLSLDLTASPRGSPCQPPNPKHTPYRPWSCALIATVGGSRPSPLRSPQSRSTRLEVQGCGLDDRAAPPDATPAVTAHGRNRTPPGETYRWTAGTEAKMMHTTEGLGANQRRSTPSHHG